MPTRRKNGSRLQQRQRTRKDLLAAAGRMLQRGRTPADMDEVAREAMVSRATAYRYFPSIEALLVEAPLDESFPAPEAIFADEASDDPVQRADRAEAALHEMVYRNEAQLRVMLAASLERKARGELKPGTPLRQNRRAALIEAALAPARRRMSRGQYQTLSHALALIFGTESMIVCNDVLGLSPRSARQVKSWALRALVRAALAQSAGRR